MSECLGLDEGQVRVIAPDVGGGFGYKGILLAEEICLGWLAMRSGHPVRWIEDRREHLTASANCREHHYRITGYADRDGTLRGIDCEAIVDSGAYSAYPFSACLEAAQVASILPGPYDFPSYRCRTYSVATNKCPILPYRGVARTGVCFALELVLDAIAREAGIEPHEVRAKILVKPEQMPFNNITKKHFDSGDYPQSLRRAVSAIDLNAVRARQRSGEADGRLIGVGLATYCEQAAHGTSVYYGWGIPMVPGFEQATARLTPDGGLELRVGVQSHGQSLETTLAQVAHEILGIDVGKIKVVHGDTAMTPYSTGTWGSRCMVMAGGAVSVACKEIARRAARIGAQLLQADPAQVTVRGGEVVGPRGSITLREIARTWYLKPQNLPTRCRHGRHGSDHRLPAESRHRHVQLRHARGFGRRRSGDRRRGDPRLCGGRGRRQAGQPDGRRRPNSRRARPGNRHGALRGNAVRCVRTTARLDAGRLSAAGAGRNAGTAHRAYGNARRPTRSSASKASARAEPSRRRRLSPTPSTTRCGRFPPSCWFRQSRRNGCSKQSRAAADKA